MDVAAIQRAFVGGRCLPGLGKQKKDVKTNARTDDLFSSTNKGVRAIILDLSSGRFASKGRASSYPRKRDTRLVYFRCLVGHARDASPLRWRRSENGATIHRLRVAARMEKEEGRKLHGTCNVCERLVSKARHFTLSGASRRGK